MVSKEKYTMLAQLLSSYDDEKILALIEQSTNLTTSLGGKTGSIRISNQQIFFKKIPLTATEISRKRTENYINRWPPEPEIRKLFESKCCAEHELVVFCEYIPFDLDTWLHIQFKQSSKHTEDACKMVLNNLLNITQFIRKEALLHFDLHFKNILTDGNSLYLADFALGLSPSFDLSISELDFYNQHKNYDRSYSLSYFIEWILSKYHKADNWSSDTSRQVLLSYVNGTGEQLPSTIMDIVVKYAPLALEMHRFFDDLKSDINTPYPTEVLNTIYQEINV